ncbi:MULTISPECIES: phosphoribosylanthranilate isomerase [unclassified Acidocella]|uniref:phosphoribosylanthranilate isomerase n=1 Tax=unclassified Acidocella TaxID=2648610 RepID=UPI00028ECDC5|nr:MULTISPECIES: phosphoribosylanthranilate isomerase [unclassified Acidocella]EKN00177.1 N-(5'-phosphoribosyl)anthranilate isomerase [Acidocella sp. MX-AZ02]WBO59732.1 phosphoribosylanthranilate isomerase [Acidocella sp. MX-AZ03]
MSRLVKICGLKDAAGFDAAVQAGADFVGFVFFAPSPRYVTSVEAQELSLRHAGGPQRVGLFVNPGLDEVEDVLRDISLDILQVHGTKEQVQALRLRFGRPVWHALGVEREAEFPAHDDTADGYIVEAKPPPGATRPGGNAVQADWELLAKFRPAKPWLLAGGLNPANVARALAITGAPGADVSSGVERAPGEKDPGLIRAFVEAVKQG